MQLMKRWESSPGVWVDFELREETQPLLEKVSNKDLEGWLERNSDRVVPIGVLSSFEDWSQGHTEHAVQWVSSLPSGPHFDVFTQTLISKGQEGRVWIIQRLRAWLRRSVILPYGLRRSGN